MNDNTQTVATTNEPVKQTSEDSGAPDDLDTLLSEYDGQQAEQPKDNNDDVKEVVSYIKEQKEKQELKQTNDDINDSIKTIKEGLDVTLPDWAIRGKLESLASEDPRVAQAWTNRNKDRTTWNKILNKVKSDIASEFAKQPDKELTETNESLVSAVQGVSTKSAPETDDLPNFNAMSDTEFAIWKSNLK